MINYKMIPEHCRAGMKRYIEKGIIPGRFLQAVISNDLVRALGQADSINRERMSDYGSFLYNEVPMPSWGSKEKMLKWSESKLKENNK